MPDWVKRIKDADDARNSQAELRSKDSQVAEAVIRADGSALWRSLVAHLKVAAEACGSIGVKVSVAEVRCPTVKESGCRVTCAANFPAVRITYSDLIYYCGSGLVRVLSLDGGRDTNLRVCVDERGQIGFWFDGEDAVMSAEQAAEEILSPMVLFARGKRT